MVFDSVFDLRISIQSLIVTSALLISYIGVGFGYEITNKLKVDTDSTKSNIIAKYVKNTPFHPISYVLAYIINLVSNSIAEAIRVNKSRISHGPLEKIFSMNVRASFVIYAFLIVLSVRSLFGEISPNNNWMYIQLTLLFIGTSVSFGSIVAMGKIYGSNIIDELSKKPQYNSKYEFYGNPIFIVSFLYGFAVALENWDGIHTIIFSGAMFILHMLISAISISILFLFTYYVPLKLVYG